MFFVLFWGFFCVGGEPQLTTCSWFSELLRYIEWDTPPLTTIIDTCCWCCLSCGCVWTSELVRVCLWLLRAFFLSLLNTWMGAVSEMEVLMISVFEESQSTLPGECRFYDSDLHKSEVTSTHTHSWASYVCFFWEFTETSEENFGFSLVCLESELVFLHYLDMFVVFVFQKWLEKCILFLSIFFLTASVENVWVSMEGICTWVMVNSWVTMWISFCFFRSNNHFSFSCFFWVVLH